MWESRKITPKTSQQGTTPLDGSLPRFPVQGQTHIRAVPFSERARQIVQGINARVSFSRILADFDGTCFNTEKYRQIGWYLTALRREYVDFFGGEHALRSFKRECDHKGTGLFQKAIGATEDDHPRIIEKVATDCRQFAGKQCIDLSAEQITAFSNTMRNDRNALVKRMLARESFTPAEGLFELMITAQAKQIPFAIVTQSTKASVLHAIQAGTKAGQSSDSDTERPMDPHWRKLIGESANKILIVSADDFKTYGLAKKPSPEPYRFANYLVTFAELKGPIGVTGIPGTLTVNDYENAAILAKLESNSAQFRERASELLEEEDANAFLQSLPAAESVFVLEDSETGLQSAREFTTFLVDNGVGVNSSGRALAKQVQNLSEEDKHALNLVIQALASNNARADFVGDTLKGALDVLRLCSRG